MIEGETITPKIRLLRPLGPEGRSHVWVAEHTGLGTKVAIKLMGRVLSRNSSPLHRFQREAEVAAKQIQSPYVAKILEHGITKNGMPYLVMELYEGEDLGVRLERLRTMPPKDVARIISQLAKGLGKAHLLGLVHRNLKPGNIFLAEGEGGEEEVKVLDLGLSVRAGTSNMGRTTSDASIMVAPEFLSPEQIFGHKDVDFRADLWALAVLAYLALTGRVPFSGKNLDTFGTAIEEGNFAPPTSLVPDLPASVDGFFAKALQRDPVARFSTAKELAEELERALGVEGDDRTSRTSYPLVGQRISSPGSRPSGAGFAPVGTARRPMMPSEKEISERLPPEIRDAALSPPETIAVTVGPSGSRGSQVLLIAVLALAGLGTIWAGLSLLSHDSTRTHTPPAAATNKK